MESNPFLGYSRRYREIEVGGKKIKVKPKVRDAEIFMTTREITPETAKRITEVMIEMIKRANPKPDNVDEKQYQEDIEDFVAEHYGELYFKLAVLYGFATEDELKRRVEELKKKAVASQRS